MKAEIIKLTPELAKEMLKNNTGNRSIKQSMKFFANQMNAGEWKENGEAIIIDKNGIVKDGQHRLLAVIASNHSYELPLISGVEPDVMDTIDTGTNRTFSDVLKFNGFDYSSVVAGITKAIMKYDFNQYSIGSSNKGDTRYYVSNSRGLKYSIENKDNLLKLAKLSSVTIFRKQIVNILRYSEIALYLYVIGGYEYQREHIDFIKRISGNNSIEGTASYWLFKKLGSFKKDGISVSGKWKLYAVVKAWNQFVKGDIPINRMSININNEPDKILKL